MSHHTYHRKDGKFTNKKAAHTVTKDGERFKVVRQYRRIKGGRGEKVSDHQRKMVSHEKVVEAIERAKTRVAAVRRLLGREYVPVVEAIEALSEAYAPEDKALTFYYKGGARAEKKIRASLKKMGVKVLTHRSRKEQLKDTDDPFWKRRAKSYFDVVARTWDDADKIIADLDAEGHDVYYDR